MSKKICNSLFTSLVFTFYMSTSIANAGIITLNNNAEIAPLSLSSSFSGFYSYGIPNVASANTGFEEEGNAIMFLAEYSGDLALFTLLDAPGSSHPIRSLNMTLSDFNLSDVILVDDSREGTASGFSWRWLSCCTDGMIYKISNKHDFNIDITFSDIVGINSFKFLSFTEQSITPETIIVGGSLSIQATQIPLPTIQATPIPEPTIIAIFGLGLIGLASRCISRKH